MLSHLLQHLTFASTAILFPRAEATPPPPPPPPVISTIGGTPVPFGLKCIEDEVIAFTGPDTLACVHIDNL